MNGNNLEHLLPEHRADAELSAEERVGRIRVDRWISYSRAEGVLTRMRELTSYPPHDRMPCLLLYGATGMGKTKILARHVRDFPGMFDDVTGITRMQIVIMQMPPEPDEKSFYSELIDALGSPVYHGHTASQMRRTARDLLSFVNARMLIIDELHSLLAGTHRQQRILLNTLRFVANDQKLPLVCAGTEEAKRALMTDRQLADRFEAVELPCWRNDADFKRLMASFLATLPLRQPSQLLSPGFRKAVLDHTGGVTVRIVRLIEALAVAAIQSGRERIDDESLKLLPSLKPLLSMESKSRSAFA